MANGELSLFPDEFDAPRIFRDVTDANLPSGLLEEYYDDISKGDYVAAKQLVMDNPDTLGTCIVTAATLEKMYDMNLSLQKFLKDTWKAKFADYFTTTAGISIIFSETEPEIAKAGSIWLKPVSSIAEE